MVVIAYYDASSKEEVVNVPLVVAGIAASEAKWVQFDPEWREVLEKHRVEFLDMAKCAQWQGQPYDTWEREEAIRVPFLGRLAEILTNTATQAVVVRILPSDFNAVNERYCLGNEYWPSAYPIAALKCMALMEELLFARPDVERLAHVVEKGDTGQGALAALIDAMQLPITILPKQDCRTKQWVHPFGACDMMAYEYRKAIQTKLSTGKHRFQFRGALRALQGIPTKVVYMSQSDLTSMCEADPIKYPRRS